MKLGLLGYPIAHSLSPQLYQRFLGDKLTSYEMFSCPRPEDVPSLDEFARKLDGLNITSPYKTHFINQVTITSELVKKVGAVNTLAFTGRDVYATNTDLLAVEAILQNFQEAWGKLELIILGDGVMASMTKLVAEAQGLPFQQFSRRQTPDLAHLNLSQIPQGKGQVIVINACNRDFIFRGTLSGQEIFWDYNYHFSPHQQGVSPRVKSYIDGQEMLERQAKAAIAFWKKVTPKLK